MLCSLNNLTGFYLVAPEGDLGAVKQFFFDDEYWTVRYLVVNTGDRSATRHLLLSPFAINHIDYNNRKLHVAQTSAQVQGSSNIDRSLLLMRGIEATYSDYYRYSYYGRSPLRWHASVCPDLPTLMTPATLRTATSAAAVAMARVVPPRLHLHSTQEVSTYHLAATDGLIGYVNDFLVHDVTWRIRFLVVDTRNWLLGSKVLLAPTSISSINWVRGQVEVQLSRDAIRQCPEYNCATLIS